MRQSEPALFRSFASDQAHFRPMHCHTDGQFTFVRSGVISLRTETCAWVNETGRLFWIPPRLAHASYSQGPVDGWLVLIDPEHTGILPDDACALEASPLLMASLLRFETIGSNRHLAKLLLEIIRIEVNDTQTSSLMLRLPTSEKLLSWSLGFLEMPTVKASMEMVASAVGMSARAFSRHFKEETGHTFAQWRQTVLVQKAIETLARGESVMNISFELGYENPSAFIAMFKSTTKMSPKRFMSENKRVDL